MKPLFNVLINIFFLFIAISCQSENKTRNNNSLVGKWKLVQSMNYALDDSTKWHRVHDIAGSTLVFEANGNFSETRGPIYASSNMNNKYSVKDSTIEFSSTDPGFTDKTYWKYIELTPQLLILDFNCDKPCRGKYIREK